MVPLIVERVANKVVRPLGLQLVHRGDAGFDDVPRLIFFHVPKCGGSSINHGLRWALKLQNVDTQRNNFHYEAAAGLRASRQLNITEADYNKIILRYALELGRIRYIYGHLHFDETALDGFRQEWKCITVLRNPKQHLLSAYYYNRYKENRMHKATDLCLRDWLETQHAREVGMVFVRTFVGDATLAEQLRYESSDGATMREAAQRAAVNLTTFTVVGHTHAMEEFEAQLNHKLGIKTKIVERNRSPKKKYPRFEDHDPSTRSRIEEIVSPNEMVAKAIL